jgi:hypothetical protein
MEETKYNATEHDATVCKNFITNGQKLLYSANPNHTEYTIEKITSKIEELPVNQTIKKGGKRKTQKYNKYKTSISNKYRKNKNKSHKKSKRKTQKNKFT